MTPLACIDYVSPLGPMLLAASGEGLAGAWFRGQQHAPQRTHDWQREPTHPVLREAVAQLAAYFSGQRHAFDLSLDWRLGTPFQQSVWRALLGIPRGETRTYSALGLALGRPTAARAVGAAVGRNPLSVIVPCHRVLGRDGSLTGYAGGLDRKTALLRLEGIDVRQESIRAGSFISDRPAGPRNAATLPAHAPRLGR
jgi:methylated-DNA-[protein]-cysteine S-methyltransferase